MSAIRQPRMPALRNVALPSSLLAPSAAPTPILRSFAQAGFDRVIDDVPANPIALYIISNPMVKWFSLPERSVGSSKNFVGFACRIAFPVLNNVADQMVWHGPHNSMDVIGHHNPRPKQIALFVE